MNYLKKALIYFIIPVAAIIVGFRYNWIIGTVLAAGYVGYVVYMNLPSIYALIGNIRYTKGSIREAAEWFGKAYNTGRAKPTTGISYGYLLLKDGDIDRSEKIFNELLKSKVSEDEKMILRSNIALVLWKKGKLDESVELLEDIHKNFKTTNIYASLGYLLTLKGDLDKALEFNLEAYKYNSTNSIILDNLGETYYHRGEYDIALETFKKLMENNPAFAEAYYHYGMVLIKKGNYEKALENMKKSLNYPITFLSAVSREEIEDRIKEIENMTS